MVRRRRIWSGGRPLPMARERRSPSISSRLMKSGDSSTTRIRVQRRNRARPAARGLAATVVTAVLEQARRHPQLQELWLQVDANSNAVGLYERMGFRVAFSASYHRP